MNHIISLHSPNELQTLFEKFEDLKDCHSIDLPSVKMDSGRKGYLKGTGSQVCFII